MNNYLTYDEMYDSIIETMKTEWVEKFKEITDGEITKEVGDYLTYNDYKDMFEGAWYEQYLSESIYEIEKLLEEKKKINKNPLH